MSRAGLLAVVLLGACARQPRPTIEPAPPELVAAVHGHVDALARASRSLTFPWTLARAADYVRAQWEAQGYAVAVQTYEVGDHQVDNLAVELPGRTPALVIVGAHYDSCLEVPGADDNASGVAALLELSARLAASEHDRTIRFVAFANEEPPYFQDPEAMGSRVYARALREQGHEVAAMLSLESIGYFSDEPGSQRYPAIVRALYPDTGDFIGVVGKNRSRPLVRAVVAGLERHGPVPVESIAAPATVPGIDWSDHWSFWREGWPMAVMITDTAIYRNPNYHRMSDRVDTLDYERLAWVVVALEGLIRELAQDD